MRTSTATIVAVAAGSVALISYSTTNKNRPSRVKFLLQSLYYSLRSYNLWNMVLAAALMTYLGRRQGFRVRLLFPTSFAVAAGLYYRFQVVETAKVTCQRTFWNVQITEKAQLTQMPFCPTFWGFNRHAQTVTCLLFSALEWLWATPIEFTCEKVEAYDGNQLDIHWARNPNDINEEAWLRGSQADNRSATSPQLIEDATPVMVLVHGLGDDRFHPYILVGICPCYVRFMSVIMAVVCPLRTVHSLHAAHPLHCPPPQSASAACATSAVGRLPCTRTGAWTLERRAISRP
jgi:hypothetical protein